jgi:malonyl-CoA/methylmalonyl-CoA synthetase
MTAKHLGTDAGMNEGSDRQPSDANLRAWRAHLGVPVEPNELYRKLSGGTLAHEFHERARRPTAGAQLVIDDVATPHGEIDDRAALLAGWLRQRGIRPGARVLISGSTCFDFIVAYLAALRTGATVVLASPHLTSAELERIVDDSEPDAMLTGAPVLEKLTRPDLIRLIVGWGGHDAITLKQAIAEGSRLSPEPVSGDAVAIRAYTSGTTGRPKAVPLSHKNLLSSIRAAMLAWRWSNDDVLVHSLPLAHQHGLGGVHASLLAGSRAALLSSFDPERLVQTMRREVATILFAVPTIYQRLVEKLGEIQPAISSLRLPISGSAPLSPSLGRAVEQMLGQTPLERYGTTESGLDVSNLYAARRLGSVGLPLPGVELRIGDESGSDVGAGEDGEILLRGPQVFVGYEASPKDLAGVFVQADWFKTGDIGRLDVDGHLTITGRLKDLIITGGMNVFPREIELAIEEHRDVQRAVVIGMPSPQWGEMVVACVVPVAGRTLDLEDVDHHARRILSKHKHPKHYVVRSEFPVDAMGKVAVSRLKQELEDALDV